MVKQTIIAHEQVNEYVSNLKCTSAVGLIFGHIANRQHFIVQLVRTPEPENDGSAVPTNRKQVSDPSIDHASSASRPLSNESRFMQHARSVNRMLPGGLLISGIFLFGSENELEKDYNAARRLLTTLHNELYAKHFANSQIEPDAIPIHEMIILTISRSAKRFTCKLYDVRDSKSIGRVVDIRFESLANKWMRFNTILNVDLPLCTSPSADCDLLLGNWERVRELFPTEMWDSRCEILVANRVLLTLADRDALGLRRLDGIFCARGSNQTDESFTVVVLTRTIASSSSDGNTQLNSNSSATQKSVQRETRLHLRGAIDSCAFLHISATLLDTLFAIKFDIVRSFLSRGDLLIDEMQIAEREVLPTTIEQRLPIRVYIDNLLCHPLIFADFIFVHETYEDVLDRVRYFLDVRGNEECRRNSDEPTRNDKPSQSGSTSSSINNSPAHSLTNLVALANTLRYSGASFVISANQPHIHFDVETPVESSETDADLERSISEVPIEEAASNRRSSASNDYSVLDNSAPRFLSDTGTGGGNECDPHYTRSQDSTRSSSLPPGTLSTDNDEKRERTGFSRSMLLLSVTAGVIAFLVAIYLILAT